MVADITLFQKKTGKPFLSLLKENNSHFASSSDVVSAMSIFDPRKVPEVQTHLTYLCMVNKQFVHFQHIMEQTSLLNGEKVAKEAIVTSDMHHRVENVSSATSKKAQRQQEFTVERTD